eukprot:6465158-Amphidinium_carterae.1
MLSRHNKTGTLRAHNWWVTMKHVDTTKLRGEQPYMALSGKRQHVPVSKSHAVLPPHGGSM